METAEFARSLEALVELARRQPTAIMCAETVPWRCHRSLIADALTARGVAVEHIMSATKANPHKLTSFAKVEGELCRTRRRPVSLGPRMILDGLLRPRKIAIVGASERPSIGRALMTSLARLGFDGDVQGTAGVSIEAGGKIHGYDRAPCGIQRRDHWMLKHRFTDMVRLAQDKTDVERSWLARLWG